MPFPCVAAVGPGSDASLRMPPNTFEPIFNGLQVLVSQAFLERFSNTLPSAVPSAQHADATRMLQAERQAVPEVARSNAYLGLITANLIHHNW